jgi:hypothetical protein
MMRITKTRHSWMGGIVVRILDLFCSVDEVWHQFEALWKRELLASGRQRLRQGRRHPSELITILIRFQESGYRTFKAFYTEQVVRHLRGEFPHLVSYTRFVELMPSVLVPLAVYLHTQLGTCTGISFIDSTDSTALAVCHPARIRPASGSTGSSPSTRAAARPRWAGSTASSGTWWSTTAARCWRSA